MDHISHDGRVAVRTVLVYVLLWILFMLGLGPAAGAICGPVDPMGAQPEMEPNDSWFLAQPLPPGLPVYGEQGPAGDSDWFQLLVPPDQGILAEMQVDFFDARLRLWGLQTGFPVLLLDMNQAGWCQGETAAFSWDPCLEPVPFEGLLLEVSSVSPASTANYRLSVFPGGGTPVPAGDCCDFPLPTVSGFPWVDTLDTRGFRDQGLNGAKDIWIPVHLDQRSLFTAGTCLAPTDFDTYLWVLGTDCETVLASDDNSCPATNRAFVSLTLDAGDYMVVLEGAGTAEGTARLQLTATGANCPPPLIPPGAVEEWEPNNAAFEATPWPLSLPMAGAIDPAGDVEWLHLLELGTGLVELRVEPGDWDPALELWAGTSAGPLLLLGQADEPGNCTVEQLQFTWDPCMVMVPGTTIPCSEAWLVIHSAPAGSGAWVATGTQVATSIPLGDCASYPIPVGSNPYSDSQDTSSGFRDQGFGPSADVWYRLDLDHSALLEADTCPAGTAFDTVLRIVGADGSTVVTSNDDSPSCALGGGRSRVSACVGSGTYFVVVEGSGSAGGVYALRIASTPQGGNARLVVGDRGSNTEFWNTWFSGENARLWLLADDPCNTVQEVDFLFHTGNGFWMPLGSDTDGSEGRMATLPGPPVHGDGWSLAFEPSALGLPPEGGPVWFMADIIHQDGSLTQATCESWYQAWLAEENLVTDLHHELQVHGDTLYVQMDGLGVPILSSAVWSLSGKQDEWRRGVPPEWQRPVSDSHCSPTAAAACLEWLDATYGTDVTCGLDGEPLVRALGDACDTNVGGPGTAHSEFFNGLQEWIDGCGGGYTVHRSDGDLEEMQDQAESQDQDVIATLEWSGGGAHSVTLSSFRNIPNADGTHTVDFMDPWTGETEEGQFDPATGNFSGYGDSGASGTLGPVYYVCPTASGPGGGGGGAGGGTIGPPFPNPLPLPLPHGRWYLKLSLVTQSGHSRDLFSIVSLEPAVAPVVRLIAQSAEGNLRLEWEAVPGAVAYRVFGLTEPWATERTQLAEVTETWLELALPEPEARYFFQVETVYER